MRRSAIKPCHDLRRRAALLAEGAEAEGGGAFCEALAVGIEHEWAVVKGGWLCSERAIEEKLACSAGE